MTTYQILNLAFSPNFQLSGDEVDGFTAIRSKKSCCIKSVKVKQTRKAVEAATRWINSNQPPINRRGHQEFIGLYNSVSRYRRRIHKMTHGLIGWLKSLFRGKKATKELRKLEASLAVMQKTMRTGGRALRSLLKQTEAPNSSSLLKQIKAQIPEAVVSRNSRVTASNFGLTANNRTPNAPFLLQRGDYNYNVIFPPADHHGEPQIIAINSLLELPRFLRERHCYKMIKACASINVSEAELIRNIRQTVNKLHIGRRMGPGLDPFEIQASYRDLLTGRVRKNYFTIHGNETESSVLAWANGLILHNQVALAEVDARIGTNNQYGIQADLAGCKYYASVDVGEGIKYFSSEGLGRDSFQHLELLIANHVNQIKTKKANKEFFEKNKNKDGKAIIEFGQYKFIIRREENLLNASNTRLFDGYKIYLEKMDQKVCKIDLGIVSDEESLEKALVREVNTRCRYHAALKDLLVSLDKLKEAKENDHTPKSRDLLLQSVALTVKEEEDLSSTLFKVHYWDPTKPDLQIDESRINSPVSLHTIRNWIKAILYNTNQLYSNQI